MARRPTPRQRLEALSDRFERQLQVAFLAAIDDLRSGAQIGLIAERLERGDIDGALRALNVEPAAFRLFEEGIREAFIGGGVAATGAMPVLRDPNGARLVTRFDARSPGAERFMRDLAGRNLRVANDILVAARQHMTQGLVDGRNPRSVALDLAGRINRATGRREGGIIGLTGQQEAYVREVRAILSDPTRVREFFIEDRATKAMRPRYKRTDRRFDKSIVGAIRENRAVPAELIDRITGRLSDSYLLLRGETIARTEAIGALNASHRDAFDQVIASGNVQRNQVRKIWRATRDKRTRDSHRHLDSESIGIDERFSNGLQYPCDPSGPASEVVNCRCSVDYRIDYFANLT
jgi:hypothetical protein